MAENNIINTDCYIFLLAKASQKGHQLVQKRLEPYEITNIQYIVLEVLWNQEGLTAVELGKRLMIDKATLSGILERMVEGGWLIKSPDDQDKRMIRLFPSEKSQALKGKLIEEREEANEELLSGFDPEERTLLKSLLLRLL
jgi:MarR family transcriptional regulator, organic hydroperoxide resistance regulator